MSQNDHPATTARPPVPAPPAGAAGTDALHPASCAWWITASPHEWKWTQEEQEAMARAVVDLSERIRRAQRAFCGDGPDGQAAAEMFRILTDPDGAPGSITPPRSAGREVAWIRLPVSVGCVVEMIEELVREHGEKTLVFLESQGWLVFRKSEETADAPNHNRPDDQP